MNCPEVRTALLRHDGTVAVFPSDYPWERIVHEMGAENFQQPPSQWAEIVKVRVIVD